MQKGLLERLFDEKKVRVLQCFFDNPGEEFYLREVAREADVSPATTYRIIQQLLDLKIIDIEKMKKTKLYKLAQNSRTERLKDFFEVKSNPLEELVSYISDVPGVEKIVLHGEATEDKVNILVIGENIASGKVTAKSADIEEKYDINVVEVTLSEDQFKRMSEMGSFPRKKTLLWKE